MKEIKGEAHLTFFESTSIIVGHGVGSGILSVPFLASGNSWWDMLLVIFVAYGINLVMHFVYCHAACRENTLSCTVCNRYECHCIVQHGFFFPVCGDVSSTGSKRIKWRYKENPWIYRCRNRHNHFLPSVQKEGTGKKRICCGSLRYEYYAFLWIVEKKK